MRIYAIPYFEFLSQLKQQLLTEFLLDFNVVHVTMMAQNMQP